MNFSDNINSAIVFSTELDIISISGVNAELSFAIAKNDVVRFETKYTPDTDGNITIYGIRKILDIYIDNVFSDFSFIFNETTFTIRVFKSSIRFTETASYYLSSFFLTTLQLSKISSPERFETLSFYPQTGESYDVYAAITYYNGIISTKEITLIAAADLVVNEVNTLDVSPHKFEDDNLGTIISVVVNAGKRSFVFYLDGYQPSAEPALLFCNNFGCWETIYLTGTMDTESEFKRSHALINGAYRQYDYDEAEILKANSGILLGNMLRLGMDLARSKSIYMLDSQGKAGEELIITSSEIKYSNDDDALPSFDFTFRRSLMQPLFDVFRPAKLFDSTFDITYN